MRDAADCVVLELGLPLGLGLRDIVASAAAELGLPLVKSHSTDQNLLDVCRRLGIDTGWARFSSPTTSRLSPRGGSPTPLRLSPRARPMMPTSRTGAADSPLLIGGSNSPSHLHEDWFTSQGFSPTRSPRSSPGRSNHRRVKEVDSRKLQQQQTSLSTNGTDYVSVEVTGDVRGLSLAVFSLNISSDVGQLGQSPLAHGSAEADAYFMGLKAGLRSAAFCELTEVGLHRYWLGDIGTSAVSSNRFVPHEIQQHLESRENIIFKESAKHTKEKLQATIDLRACSTHRFCDSLVIVLFETTMSTASDVLNHRAASNGRSGADLQRPILTRRAQPSVARNKCRGKMVEATYTPHEVADVCSPYRGGIRVGGGFRHLSPPAIKALDQRISAKEIHVTIRRYGAGLEHDDTIADTISMGSMVQSQEWTGAVLMYAQPHSALWDDLVGRVHERKERRTASKIQALCRQMIERQRFLAYRCNKVGQRHMESRQWELACAIFRTALSVRFISLIPQVLTEQLRQALHNAEESLRRRDSARKEVQHLLAEGNRYADSMQPDRAVECYEAAFAVQSLDDDEWSAKLEHLRWELSEGKRAGAMHALTNAPTELEMTRLHARTCLAQGHRLMQEGEVQDATEAYHAAVQLAQTLSPVQSPDSLSDPLMHEVLGAVANARQYLASSPSPNHEA